MLFSICIITYNRPDETLALLRCLMHLNKRYELLNEVILINNNSDKDYTAVTKFIQTEDLPILYVENQVNNGVAKSRNQAVNLSKGEYLIFIDDDAEIDDFDFLVSINGFWQQSWVKEEKVGILNLCILYYSTREIQRNAFPHKKFNKFKHIPEFFTYYFTGAAHIMRRELFLQLGGFPEDFFYGSEEYDLSFRCLDQGYKIYYLQNPCILHKESPSGRLRSPHKWGQMWLNRTKVAYRYLPWIYIISTILIWSSYFLIRFPLSFKIYLTVWREIFLLPKTNTRQPLKESTMHYLKYLQARLWY